MVLTLKKKNFLQNNYELLSEKKRNYLKYNTLVSPNDFDNSKFYAFSIDSQMHNENENQEFINNELNINSNYNNNSLNYFMLFKRNNLVNKFKSNANASTLNLFEDDTSSIHVEENIFNYKLKNNNDYDEELSLFNENFFKEYQQDPSRESEISNYFLLNKIFPNYYLSN